ncbi:hypothetical protein IGI57_002484 [Enterococcus sp. DIV0213j]|uniref:hypothetical protein n=1 Tax=Enterococcus sp. DIV0213j TaxID=2774649 RepID=UPI003D2E1C22
MKDNSKYKGKLNEQLLSIKKALEEHFGIKLFQDSVGEDELPKDFNYFILETGEIELVSEPKYSLGQNIYLTFYSENREDLTGDVLDIISLIQTNIVRFQRMDPNHLKLENQDRYIDQLVFTFRRLLKSDCHG